MLYLCSLKEKDKATSFFDANYIHVHRQKLSMKHEEDVTTKERDVSSIPVSAMSLE